MSDLPGGIQGERIATASKALGIPVPTIRSWERRYGFPAPPRTDGLHRRYSPVGRPVLLACPPGERHTLGLEAFAVLLARRQVPARSLGADTPGASILAAVRKTGARGVVITAHRNVVRRSAVSVLAAVDRVAPSRSFYAGNAFATPRARLGVAGTYLGDDLLEAAALIRRTLTPRNQRV